MKAAQKPIHAVTTWVRRQPPKVKAFLGVVSAMAALVLLRMIVHDHDNFFVAAEAVHALGISVLIYKLSKEKTCAGNHISLLPNSRTFLVLKLGLITIFCLDRIISQDTRVNGPVSGRETPF